MTKQYDIIHLPDGFMYGIDKETEILDGEWCFEIHEEYPSDCPRFQDKDNLKMSWWLRELNMDYLKEKPKEFRFWRKMDGSCMKIVFTNNPSLELPLLPDIEEKNELMEELMRLGYTGAMTIVNRYKAASAKKYTEEDMYNVAKLCALASGNANNYSETMTEQRVKSFIQSLSPKPIAVEVEMSHTFPDIEEHCEGGTLPSAVTSELELKLIVNKVVVKQWIYE